MLVRAGPRVEVRKEFVKETIHTGMAESDLE